MGFRLSNKTKIHPIDPPCKKTIYNSLENAQAMIKYIVENREVQDI
jgi:hypothetical protein